MNCSQFLAVVRSITLQPSEFVVFAFAIGN